MADRLLALAVGAGLQVMDALIDADLSGDVDQLAGQGVMRRSSPL